MPLVLPPNVSEKNFQKALDAFAGVVGRQWVLATDEDRNEKQDQSHTLDGTPGCTLAAALVP